MVSAVTLGNFFTVNGRTVMGGAGGSGLDTKGLVESLAEAKRLPAVKLEDKVKVNDTRNKALTELKKLISTLKDSANFLRNPPGVGNAADNVFKYTATNVSSNTSVAGSTYMSVTASPGTSLQSYKIDSITSVAKAKKQVSEVFNIADADTAIVSAAPTANQFKAGSFKLKDETITFADGDSLNTVVAKINEVSADTKISASVVQVQSGQYQIVFSATATGLDTNFDFNDTIVPPGDLTGTLEDTDSVFSNITVTTTQNASNAEFKLDGVTIIRQGNNISDAVSGLTFSLLQPTPVATELNVSVNADTQIAKNGIVNFINAYNDLRIFYAKQTHYTDDGKPDENAALIDNVTLRTLMNSVSNEVSAIIGGITEGNYTRLADIGITFADLPESEDNPLVRNIMTLDEGKLSAALASNFSQVKDVFGVSFTSNNANLILYSATNAVRISDFSLNLNPATSTYEATYDDNGTPVTIALDAVALSGGGYTLKGRAGTVLEGLIMVYGSDDPASINVTLTQGIASRTYNVVNPALTEDTGSIALEFDSLQENTDSLEEEIRKIDEQVERFREQLLAKFSALEAAISQVNTILQSLDAQAKARENAT